MYGYLRPLKSPDQDFTLFRAHYCSLCKTIQSEYGLLFRVGLSYEIVFFALFLNALQKVKVTIRRERCPVHPFREQAVFEGNPAMNRCAHLNMALIAGKLTDDIADEEPYRLFRKTALHSLEKRSGPVYKGYFQFVGRAYESIRCLERRKSEDVDALAALFGELLALLFQEVCRESRLDPPASLIHFSQLLGRWIYCIDAVDDLQKDFQRKRYNPLIYRYKDAFFTSYPVEEAFKSIISQETVRLRLLSEHMMSEYRLFRRQLGLYSVEIDDIIFRSIPYASARIARKNMEKEKK